MAAIRAEGHYTQLYTEDGKFFCAWSITEAEKRLTPDPLIRTHRSYLINPAHVTGFERLKDNGVCLFDVPGLPKVPVSRSRLKVVRETLGV
ncbi:MAG: LytTR family DNA-binding domain-containing protein [Thalassovita sp.]|nr:LytTR family DNA-binding domain-containing protein [Thalassovita sp.]